MTKGELQDLDKHGNTHVENVVDPALNDELAQLSPEQYAAAERKLIWKLDLRIMPCLWLMIVLNYLDRNALANARIQGIEESLNLKGSQFNTAISVLFAGYIALQIPSNLILTRVRPSLYLPGCMAAWGVVSGLSAAVHNFEGLVIVRFFLGMVEAPYFPGALLLLSSWYTKRELALRTSVLYSGSLLAGGFGGLVGAGVQSGLDGSRGLDSWRWLFIIEASLTVFVALCSMLILPDYPHSTKSLSPLERAIAVRRIQVMASISDEKKGSVLYGLRLAITDYKVWLLSLMMIAKTSAGAVMSFIPTLAETFGYGKVETLLLVAPPYVFATIVALAVSYSSDRFSERAYHVVIPMVFAMAGYIMAASTLALPARYLSLFLMLAGQYGPYNVALAWISSTIPQPLEKRSAAIAIINTIGNIAQIYSPYFYFDGPRYYQAMIANACFCLACLCATLILRWCLLWENRKLASAEANEVQEPDNGRIDEKGFRYLL
ncbi:uncharacterized protein K452DRAFT_74939 [Aplosporella prunicola CBS 121167]|uniref:Major facilitator superfamily (MFS) profile domain-containing protein n=1 Tax=Aplosporella prunicola CBS 121167 TaxID=1176127 RepID=A0A6A6B7W1_9PEZI|nr:uncharacterized protein K452DRAFT_74939 [Aplosporella prunicola CBS 121167]KAF2139294.1 hypothetical protein K452DRAFT_74939 [Aplosporella prunicola CBS 121167]